MSRMNRLLPTTLMVVSLLALFGCGADEIAGPQPGAGAVPDFSLTDLNPGSPTSGKDVSPRQYLGKISAWYFGHST